MYYQQSPYAAMILKGRPVTSLDEAKAASIDYDGSVFYFPDLANKRIYTKQINMDGTVSLLMYEMKELPVEKKDGQGIYVTKEEFNQALEQLRGALTQNVSKEEARLTEEIKKF